MNEAFQDRSAIFIGLVSTSVGIALLAAPEPTSRAMGLGDDRAAARAVGVADLAVGAGLLSRRAPAAWLLGRAAVNLLIAALYRREAARPGAEGAARARAGAATMLGLTVFDGNLARLARERG